MPLYNRLKEHRNKLGVNQEEMGRLVGVSRQTISLIERGDYSPSVTLALKLAAACGVTVEDIFRGGRIMGWRKEVKMNVKTDSGRKKTQKSRAGRTALRLLVSLAAGGAAGFGISWAVYAARVGMRETTEHLNLAFLENGLSLSDTVDCNGWTEVSGIRIRCAARYGHGPLSIEEAIQRSCNDFFIENALEIGIDKLSAMYASAGIGRKTGFELSERSGLLPKGEPGWTRTETAFVGIGQGRVEVTPLQAITYISAIANGGKLYRPYIIDRVLDGSGNVLFRTRPEVTGNLAASRNSLDIVSTGMYLAVNAPRGGSAAAAKNSKIELHGKTGTAEVGPLNARYKNTWFTAFGVEPESQKIYSIIILVGHGRSGGGTCAPLAREFFERWLTKPQT